MIKKFLLLLICFVLFLNFVNCGTILYPERKGQKSGVVDPGVIAMNTFWCFVFIIPGVIAYYVDLDNGTIYRQNSYLAPEFNITPNYISEK